jgi:hypothetical protein
MVDGFIFDGPEWGYEIAERHPSGGKKHYMYTLLGSHLYTKKRSIYQDRLGTNIRKVLKMRGVGVFRISG